MTHRACRSGFILLAGLILGGTGCKAGAAQEVDASVRASVGAARPLLVALERFRAERGRYPQYLDELVPGHLESLPTARAGGGREQPFVYSGQGASFEIFFLGGADDESQFLHRSTAEYPARLEPGPWALVRSVGEWAWYRLIPLRPVEVLREWRGRIALERSVHPLAFVADADALRTLWEAWGLEGPVPRVDFERHLLLVGVARSSLVSCMGPTLDDRGDVSPNVVATPDHPGFWSYALCLVERAGIRTVGGAPVG